MSVLTVSKKETEGTPCHFCPIHIFEEHESGSVIHYKNGNPICARCRILQGSSAARIVADKDKRDADIEAVNQKVQGEANADVLVVAEKTQTATKTKRKK